MQINKERKVVAGMFDNISSSYDFLNHFLSLGIDKRWRRKAVRLLKKDNPQSILDVATGTGDLALTIYKYLKPKKVIGVDISKGMLSVGKEKVKKKNLADFIELKEGDATALSFENNSFDAATVSFGVRNFEDLKKGLLEIKRVLRPGGKFMILEFSKPKGFLIRTIYKMYFKYILPLVGGLVSKDKQAYTYLPDTVMDFPEGDEFVKILTDVNYKNIKCYRLSFGISTIYLAEK